MPNIPRVMWSPRRAARLWMPLHDNKYHLARQLSGGFWQQSRLPWLTMESQIEGIRAYHQDPERRDREIITVLMEMHNGFPTTPFATLNYNGYAGGMPRNTGRRAYNDTNFQGNVGANGRDRRQRPRLQDQDGTETGTVTSRNEQQDGG